METHKHTHTLNLDLTLPVCYAICLQYFTKKKNINSAPQQGAGSFHVCGWRICERALHPIMRVEVQIPGRAEELEGGEETSIFGDGILMVSRGRGPLWAPLLRWQRRRNLQETEQERMSFTDE